MLALLVPMVGLVASVLLFRLAMPSRSEQPRWFIGTAWESYIVVALISGMMLSLGFVAFAIISLAA